MDWTIERGETLRYLHIHPEALDRELEKAIDRCEAQLRAAARPRCVWRLFDREEDGRLAGTAYCPSGRDIRRHLDGCDQVILMAATLGSEAETCLRRAQHTQIRDAVLLDAAANAAVESVCDSLCAELAQRFAPRFLTERYSPGYGDLPLSEQEALCAILDLGRRIGVSLTPGGLLIPQKTVTAFIGLSDRPVSARRGCEGCAGYENCAYRREGLHCGS